MERKTTWVRSLMGLLAGLLLAVTLVSLFPGKIQTVQAAKESNPYEIQVNKKQNTVTVYEKGESGEYDEPVKAFVCSVGVATPLGTYYTPQKYRWRLMIEDVWSQYATRIVGGILFHSVWYYKKDPSTLSARQYNKLGVAASHGCVRLTCADAKWIYDNCPIGTKVIIYSASDPGPLGKPKAITLPSSTGWDPTDIWSKQNPWNKKTPTITGAKNKTVEYGSKVNLKKGIKAKGTTGYALPASAIKVTGKVDTTTPGKYKITYKVTDEIGRTKKKTITITVKGDTTKPVFSGVSSTRYLNKVQEVNRALVMEGVSASFRDEPMDPEDISTEITSLGENSYQVVYSCTGPNNIKATKTMKLYMDTQAPVFEGLQTMVGMKKDDFNAALTAKGNLKEATAMAGITVTDNLSTLTAEDVTWYWQYLYGGEYMVQVTLTVADQAGNRTDATYLISLYD